jgi:hypothetical protein
MVDFLREFWLELTATITVSIVAALLYRCLGGGDKLRQNWRLFRCMSRLVIRNHSGWESCEDEIVGQFRESARVDILCIKGRGLGKTHLCRDALRERIQRGRPTRILLQSPNSPYVNEQISKEFGWSSLESFKGNLVESIECLSREVADVPDRSSVLRLYKSKPILRLYIFDKRLYLSVYAGRKVEEEDKKRIAVWCLARDTNPCSLTFVIERFFESIWEQGHAY